MSNIFFRFLLFSTILVEGNFCCAQIEGRNYKLINGNWFDGTGFNNKVFYVEKGLFKEKAPSAIDSVIDLHSQYVIPPFADAHNHAINSSIDLEKKIASFLKNGIYYIKNPNVIAKRIGGIKDKINTPESVDVSFANGGITGKRGHPIKLHETLTRRGVFPGYSIETLEGQAFFSVESERELLEKWSAILKGKPGFIKIFLLNSENFDERKDDDYYYGRKGLDPKLASIVVSLAHQANLRVSAHVSTAADFRCALDNGADEINHLPGFEFDKEKTFNHYKLSNEDAQKAADKKIFVVTTTRIAPDYLRGDTLEKMKNIQRANLALLYEHHVSLAIGSDGLSGQFPMPNAIDEITCISSLGGLSPLALLQIACEKTPQTIFPHRKIGFLKEGYEASFIVLKRNPLADISALKEISVKMKQGYVLK